MGSSSNSRPPTSPFTFDRPRHRSSPSISHAVAEASMSTSETAAKSVTKPARSSKKPFLTLKNPQGQKWELHEGSRDKLKPTQWLNDEVVEAGIAYDLYYHSWLGSQGVRASNQSSPKAVLYGSHVITWMEERASSVTGRVRNAEDPFQADLILFPIHSQDALHWALAIVLEPWKLIPGLSSPSSWHFDMSEAGAYPQTKKGRQQATDVEDGSEQHVDFITLLQQRHHKPNVRFERTFDPGQPTIIYLDSLGRSLLDRLPFVAEVLWRQACRLYPDQIRTGHGIDWVDGDSWQQAAVALSLPVPNLIVAETPQQPNAYDCGIYVIHFASCFLHDPSSMLAYILADQQAAKAGSIAMHDSSKQAGKRKVDGGHATEQARRSEVAKHWHEENVQSLRALMLQTFNKMASEAGQQ